MKYHYQLVSKTTVRIELIPEDKKEIVLIESLQSSEMDNLKLIDFYSRGLQAYSSGAILTKTNFMSFPKVALCTFMLAKTRIEKIA